jgi:hypothetical protein
VPVEAYSVGILRLDDKRESLYVSFESPKRRVGKEYATQAKPLKAVIDCKATNQRRGQYRVARQASNDLIRQIATVHAGSSERVKTGDHVRGGFDGYKAARHKAPHVLRGLLAKIAIERRRVTGKGRTIVPAERLNDERVRHREVLISFR